MSHSHDTKQIPICAYHIIQNSSMHANISATVLNTYDIYSLVQNYYLVDQCTIL